MMREKLDLHALALGRVGGGVVGAGVEADDDGLGGLGEQNVRLRNRPDRGEDDVEIDLLAVDFLERGHDGFHRALHVALDDELENLVLFVGNGLEKIFERDRAAAPQACPDGACRRDLPPAHAPRAHS
jgi:hypothetical protein